MNHRKLALGMLTAGLLLGSAALAEDVWIKSDNVDIRTGKGAIYPVVVTIPKGQRLSVTAHEGHWLKVQVADKAGNPVKDKDGSVVEGYVFDGAISPDKVDDSGGLLSGVVDTSELGNGKSAKGIGEDAQAYSNDKKLDPNAAPALDALVAFKKNIDPKLWEAFVTAGKVGTAKP